MACVGEHRMAEAAAMKPSTESTVKSPAMEAATWPCKRQPAGGCQKRGHDRGTLGCAE